MVVRRLFLVDDDIDEEFIFGSALKVVDPDIELFQAVNGERALEYLAGSDSVPDMIFLDLNMPVMGGLRCLELLKDNPAFSHIPVIIYTTSADPSVISQAKEIGAVDFITKPARLEDLIALLKAVLDELVL